MIPFKIKNLKELDKNILKNKEIINKINKVQASIADKGRIVVRPSGTESLIRVMVESSSSKLIDDSINKITMLLQKSNESNKKTNHLKSLLIIAGSDCSGGAGIQADLKTLSYFGVYGMTAITALTAQNTLGVHQVENLPIDFVQKQIDVCISDIGVDAIKIGMVHKAEIFDAIYDSFVKFDIINNKKIKMFLIL